MDSRSRTADKLPYLSSDFLDSLMISTSEVVGEIERQIIGQRQGTVWCAPKAVVLPGDDRYIMATLGVASEPRVLATKSLVVNPRNAERGLATLNSLISLLDADTGLPLALVDGNWVTTKRTAGLSAVAARRWAIFIHCGTFARSVAAPAIATHFAGWPSRTASRRCRATRPRPRWTAPTSW